MGNTSKSYRESLARQLRAKRRATLAAARQSERDRVRGLEVVAKAALDWYAATNEMRRALEDELPRIALARAEVQLAATVGTWARAEQLRALQRVR